MKKGFTLIELLAVIVVLGIIGVITVPIYLNAIQSQREKAFIESEKGIIRGTRNYLNFNTHLYPLEIGDLEVVSFKTLQEEKFINEIKSLTGSSCSGYIVVIKTSEVTYDYKPYYKCDGTELNSPEEEGLVLDYSFNDHQEPTINLISDVYGSIYTGYTGLTITDVVDNDALTQHAKRVEVNMEEINGSARIKFGDATNIQTNTYYFATIYIKKDEGVTANIVPRVYSGFSWYNMTALDDYEDDYIKDNYRRFGAYIYTGTTSGGPNPAFGAFDYGASTGDVFYFSSPQVEEKQYASPYTENSRSGSIKDYSLNERTSALNLSTTPRWVSDRGGAYLFNGVNSKIETPYGEGINVATNPHTISVFVKANNPATNSMFISTSQIPNATNRFYVGTYNGKWDMGIRSSSWGSGTISATTDWTHIALVMDGSVAKLYVNGVLGRQISYISYTLNRNFHLSNHDNNYYFNGYIDDFKIYDRALSLDEIINLYQIEQLK